MRPSVPPDTGSGNTVAKHLGEFGTARPALDSTFGWLGETFRVHPDLTDLNLVAFLDRAGQVDEADETTAMALVTGQLRGLVHPDDWDAFIAHSIAQRQHYVDLMVLMKGLIEAVSDRPTKRRSDSPGGRRKTPGKSKGPSSSRVIKRLETAGRPDLALAVVQADDARRSA